MTTQWEGDFAKEQIRGEVVIDEYLICKGPSKRNLDLALFGAPDEPLQITMTLAIPSKKGALGKTYDALVLITDIGRKDWKKCIYSFKGNILGEVNGQTTYRMNIPVEGLISTLSRQGTLSSVESINWPSKKSNPVRKQQARLREQLESHC